MKMQAVFAAVVLAFGASSAMAVTVVLTGTHINVTYDTADVGLFGAPTLTGDTLSWSPPSFLAKANGGPTVRTSQTQVKIIAHSGFNVAQVGYSEGGTYTKVGAGLVSATGAVDVAAESPAAPAVHVPFTTGGLAAANNASWNAAVAPINFGAGTTRVSFLVSNTLKSFGAAAGPNMIAKTLPTLSVVVVAVPEPETYAMMLAGIAALGFIARRRSAA